MTTIQKNVLEVVEAMLLLTRPPSRSANDWTKLLSEVSFGRKYVLDTRRSIYSVLKAEPTVFRRLLPFLEITPRQGESLAQVHGDSVRVAQLQKAWRMLY
jgi:hypothetical protein